MMITDYAAEETSLPWYYGFAYRRPDVAATAVYIIPLNWVARWARSLLFRVRGPLRLARFELAESAAQQAGFVQGRRASLHWYREGWEAAFQYFHAAVDLGRPTDSQMQDLKDRFYNQPTVRDNSE